MNIIFVGDVLPRNVFESVSKVAPSTNNVELTILKFLYNAYRDRLHVLSKNFNLCKLQTKRKVISDQSYITDEKIEIHTIKFINHKLLKNITGMFYLYHSIKKLKKELKAKGSKEYNVFIVYNPYYQNALPIYFAKAHNDIIISIIAEGLDIRYIRDKKVTLYDNISHLINKTLFKKNAAIITYCANTVKKYAPKVEYIELLHPCDINLFDGVKKNTNVTKTITLLYAGMLESCYGIYKILDVMKCLPDNYNLIICGGGSSEIINLLKETEKYDNRIRYKGLISREEVIKLEVAADILLFIRVTNSPVNMYLAQYCQASKISEYLMSGTPIIATKIPSTPMVFDRYLNYTSENIDEITKTILSVIRNENDVYSNKANDGKIYAQHYCTYEAQYLRLLEFIHKIGVEKFEY